MSADDFVIVLCILYLLLEPVDGNTRITITAPVNPVRTGNMFAVYCQVWNLREDHDVLLTRSKSGLTEKISVSDGQLQPDIDERFFLAKRRKNDGSVVYFLSVVDARLSDDALYTCKVYALKGTFVDVDAASQHIEVQYFPHERYPVCASNPDEPIDVYEGRRIALSCRSEMANPVVQIRWRRVGDDKTVTGFERSKNGILYSELRILTKETDDKAIFLCEITSHAFYGRTQRCHIGPITVIPVPKVTTHTTISTPLIPKSLHQDTTTTSAIPPKASEDPCYDKCSHQKSLLFYWTIAAVISFVLCLVFLIMSVILCCKVSHITNVKKPRPIGGVQGVVRNYVIPPRNPETVYVRLHRNSNSDRVYMTLEGYDSPDSRVFLPKEIYDKYYNRAHMTRL